MTFISSFVYTFEIKLSAFGRGLEAALSENFFYIPAASCFQYTVCFPLPTRPSRRPASEQQCSHRGQHYRFTSRTSCFSTRIHQRHVDPHGRSDDSPSSPVWAAPARVRKPFLSHAFPTEQPRSCDGVVTLASRTQYDVFCTFSLEPGLENESLQQKWRNTKHSHSSSLGILWIKLLVVKLLWQSWAFARRERSKVESLNKRKDW
jgi:hypothetical protein